MTTKSGVSVRYLGDSGRLRVPRARGEAIILERGGPEVDISGRLFRQLSADPTIRLEVVRGDVDEPATSTKPEPTGGQEENADG
jgi:hypothetical protein